MESEKPYSKKNNYYEKSDFNQKNSGSGKKFSIVSTEKKDQTSDKVGNSKIQPQVHLLTKYSNFDWTKISIDESYSNFKELEKVLKALVEENPKQTVQLVSDFASLRDSIIESWERILKEDLKYAFNKEIDKRLWSILKRPIEILSKDKKKEEGHKENLIKLIDKHIEIIKRLIQNAKDSCKVAETEISSDCIERKIFSNLLSYLGELFQTREKTSSGNPQLSTSIDLYFRAISLYPYEGKYFMLLSNCSKMKDDLFGAIYWGIRAYCCTNSYPMKENILKFLEESRLAYLTMLENDWMEVKNNELFKYFMLSYLRFLNIILTKIGFEELSTVSNNMFEYLEKYIHYLITDGKTKDNSNELSLFQQVVMLIVYALYNSIQGYNPKDDDPNKFLNPPEKKFTELASDDLAKECLKYSYAILYHILELIITNFNENTINIIMPFFYYAIEHKSVIDYLLTTYKNLKDKLTKFNEKIKANFEIESEKLNKNRDELSKICEESLFSSDKILLGYIPIMKYVEKRKIYQKKLADENVQFACKILTLEIILDNIGCNDNHKDQKVSNLFDLKDLDHDNVSDETKKHITNFGMGLNTETKEKKIIIIDGQNVAIRYGDTRFSSMGLKLAIDCFKEKGHEVHVVLPDYYFNKEEVALKRQLAISKDEGMKHIPDDVDLLIDLKAKGFAFGVPNWDYDDSFIIDYAKKKNAYIVTNDRYNDHIEKYSKNDPTKRKKLKDWMRSNCISFTFIGKEFIPNPDFMNNYMK